MNADEYTPYAEYCTGNANTPYSVCGRSAAGRRRPDGSGSAGHPGIAVRGGDHRRPRQLHGPPNGAANWLLYTLLNTRTPDRYFHDITGAGQVPNNNGLFPTTRNYDEATGIGSPIMAPIITGRP